VTVNVTDPSQRAAQIEMLQRYAKVLKKCGGSYLVQSANGPRKGYVFAEHKANPNANIMHELDGSANMQYTPRQTITPAAHRRRMSTCAAIFV
jgi:hypothetical protein